MPFPFPPRLARYAVTLLLPISAAMAALGVLAINESAYQNSVAAISGLGDRGKALDRIQNVLQRLVDAETGQRGYLITGRPDYLDPYEEAGRDIHSSLKWLTTYYGKDPISQQRVLEMRKIAEEKLSELNTTLELRQQGRDEAWMGLMLTDIGREKMEALREQSTALMNIEGERVARDRTAVYSTLNTNRLGMYALVALSLLALGLFVRQMLRLDTARREHALALQTERDHLESEVVRRTGELTELTRHLQTAREDERQHIARNLHDELGALLTTAKLDAARLKLSLGDMPPDSLARLQHLNDTINEGIRLKRRIIEDLRPSALSNLGLVQALEIQAREFGELSEISMQTDLEDLPLSDSAQIAVYRMVQESLTNIAKYAQAKRVEIGLRREGTRAHIHVRDDGRGFDAQAPRAQRHGLIGMRYRAESEHGTMRVTSTPGRGTCIDVWLPLAAKTEKSEPAEKTDPAPTNNA